MIQLNFNYFLIFLEGKKMPSKVYKLISKKKEKFTGLYTVTQKTSVVTGRNHHLLEPNNFVAREVVISSSTYNITGYHLTVNEDVKLDDEQANSSFDVTISLESEKQKLNARVYFDIKNKLISAFFRNEIGELIKLENIVDIEQAAKSYSLIFYKKLYEANSEITKDSLAKHEALMGELTELSGKLNLAKSTDDELVALEALSNKIDDTVIQLSGLIDQDLFPKLDMLHYLNQLSTKTINKIKELNNSLKETKPAENAEQIKSQPTAVSYTTEKNKTRDPIKEELNNIDQQLAILSVESSQNNQPQKLIKKHQLLNRKFELLKIDDQVLDCVLQIKDVKKRAIKALTVMLMTGKADHLEQLLKIIPVLSAGVLLVAMNNNRSTAIEMILTHHPYINLDIPVNDEGVILLRKAYDEKRTAIFCLLLKFGAFCDFPMPKNENRTLLIQSCADCREEEMLALLDTGASDSLRDDPGFSAFGTLSMMGTRTPPLNLLRKFIKCCKSFCIDSYQGPELGRQTALAYACQEYGKAKLNCERKASELWFEVIKFYIVECNANPTVARTSDYNSSLAILAAIGCTSVLQFILENTKYSLSKEALSQAYSRAKLYKQGECILFLENYASSKNMTLDPDSSSFAIAPGASLLESILPALQITSTPPLLSNPASLQNLLLSPPEKQTSQLTSISSGEEKSVNNPPNKR
jgi:hypothetical protein